MGISKLDTMFKPKSVAVVGASVKDGSVGRALVISLQESGYEGEIYLVNPKHAEMHGLPCFGSLTDIGKAVDLVVVAVPIAYVPEIIEEAGRIGAGSAIVVSAGGREIGVSGAAIEERISGAAKAAGIRMLGPNCLGIMVSGQKLNASFATRMCLPGRVALISQSGAICSVVLDRASEVNIGFSHFISIGAMSDIDFGDLLDYLGSEPEVSSIMMYVEALTNMRKFMSAARAVSRVKPIIVVKAGRSAAGAKAAASHTGSMVGNDEVYDAAFSRAGIIRVKSLAELFDCTEALAKHGRPEGPDIGVLTNAGGPGVITADALMDWDREPVDFSAETIEKLNMVLPAEWSHGNPADILGDATPERYGEAAKIIAKAPEVDSMMVVLTPQAMTDPAGVAKAMIPVIKDARIPAAAVWMGGTDVAEGVRLLNEAGIPVYETPERAVNTLMYMYNYSHNLELLQQTPPNFQANFNFDKKRAKGIIDSALERDHLLLTELESKALLSAYGIPVNRTEVATSEDQAVARANEIGYPVVLKIHSRDISHKSEANGIRLDLQSAEDVRAAFVKVNQNAIAYKPDAIVLGVTVQPMVEHIDYEVILGSKKDPDFGPTILFGMGGIMTEILRDKAVGLPPMNRLLARRLMESTKVFNLLRGYRNRPAANLALLEEVISRLAYLVTDFPEIVELDINPLILARNEVLATDARVVLERTECKSPDHLVIMPYPTQYETNWVMDSGMPVLVRPVRPEDEPMLSVFVQGLSAQTLYFRFFQIIKSLPHERLARFCQVDYDREMSLVAIEAPPGGERLLGVCHLFIQVAREEAELAVVVGDEHQKQGLGRKLVSLGMEIMREKGVKRIIGEVLPENAGMLTLAKKLGFTAIRDMGEGTYRIEHSFE